jgi:hypothetical protein
MNNKRSKQCLTQKIELSLFLKYATVHVKFRPKIGTFFIDYCILYNIKQN